MERFLWVCLAGACGTGARYATSLLAISLGAKLPVATLVVNVLGSFLMGAIMQVGLVAGVLSETLRVVLTAGFLGGFTTYSAFSYESVALLQHEAVSAAVLNVVATTLLCLLACWAGLWVGKLAS